MPQILLLFKVTEYVWAGHFTLPDFSSFADLADDLYNAMGKQII